MKPDPLFMAYRDNDSDETPRDAHVPPLDKALSAVDSDIDDAIDEGIDLTSAIGDVPLGKADPFEYAGDLYGPTLRGIPLLTREEEEALGRTIQESRIRMTDALARVPAAVGVFVEFIAQAEDRERPVTDALFSPFGDFSARRVAGAASSPYRFPGTRCDEDTPGQARTRYPARLGSASRGIAYL